MAANEKHVVCNCLCFLVNKFRNLPPKPLKSLLFDFYSSEDLSAAKELLLIETDALKLDKFPKFSRKRRDSTGNKTALDIDDMLNALTFLDENKAINKLPTFTATSPDRMPVRLLEADLSILWSKLSFLEETLNEIRTVNHQISENGKSNSEHIRSLMAEFRDFGRRAFTTLPDMPTDLRPAGVSTDFRPPGVSIVNQPAGVSTDNNRPAGVSSQHSLQAVQ